MQRSIAYGVQTSPHGHRVVLCDVGQRKHGVKRLIVKCLGKEAIDSLVKETFDSRCSGEDVFVPMDATVPVNDRSMNW
jgi:hypothetical protein